MTVADVARTADRYGRCVLLDPRAGTVDRRACRVPARQRGRSTSARLQCVGVGCTILASSGGGGGIQPGQTETAGRVSPAVPSQPESGALGTAIRQSAGWPRREASAGMTIEYRRSLSGAAGSSQAPAALGLAITLVFLVLLSEFRFAHPFLSRGSRLALGGVLAGRLSRIDAQMGVVDGMTWCRHRLRTHLMPTRARASWRKGIPPRRVCVPAGGGFVPVLIPHSRRVAGVPLAMALGSGASCCSLGDRGLGGLAVALLLSLALRDRVLAAHRTDPTLAMRRERPAVEGKRTSELGIAAGVSRQ